MEIAGGTADSVVDAEDTTEGVLITEVVGSGALRPRFASPTTLVFKIFLCIGDNCMSFVGGGVNGQ